MLDRFVYRKDDEKTFPDESSAPFRGSSCTTLGNMFQVAFLPATPPGISRIYVRWPGGTKPEEGKGTDLVTSHCNLILLRLTSIESLNESPYLRHTQDHFLCIASSDPMPHLRLKRLPICQEKVFVPPREEEEEQTILPRIFFENTVGLVRLVDEGSDEDDFVVIQLAKVFQNPESNMMAEVCMLRAGLSGDDGNGTWEVKNIRIQHKDEEYSDLWFWSTDDVVTFKKSVCWVDYHRGGILFYDALKNEPTISYIRLKMTNRPTGSTQCQTLPNMNRTLCATENVYYVGSRKVVKPVLRFVEVVRSDGCIFGTFDLGDGFTIKSSTLSSLDSDQWNQDINIKSQDLWALNNSSGLPHEMLTFPLVSTDDSNIVHFFVSWYAEEGTKKVSVVTLDMGANKLVGLYPYITGAEDVDMINEKSHLLKGFLPSLFSLYFIEPGMMEGWRVSARKRRARPRASGSGAK